MVVYSKTTLQLLIFTHLSTIKVILNILQIYKLPDSVLGTRGKKIKQV